jgi:ribosomal protein S18 acetylase RimI-like enzyme
MDTAKVSDTIEIADAPAIPGLRFRHWRGLDDLPAMAAVADAANRAVGSADVKPLEDMVAVYSNLSNCDPDRDIVVAEVDGAVVAYARWLWGDRYDGTRSFEGVEFVDPAHAERGIEDALLQQGIRRQTTLAAELAAGDGAAPRPAILTRYVRGTERPRIERLEALGFALVRRHAEMTRPDLAAIPEVPVPDGIVLSRVEAGDESAIRRAYDLNVEVFATHYGEALPTEADWALFRVAPDTQPGLWCVAIDRATGEAAGHILNYLAAPGPDGSIVGWTESIAVRAPYRRRGLASAMLAESLRIVRDAGATSAALGVDQQNENRAMALYERLGFRRSLEELEYRRPIELEGVRR